MQIASVPSGQMCKGLCKSGQLTKSKRRTMNQTLFVQTQLMVWSQNQKQPSNSPALVFDYCGCSFSPWFKVDISKSSHGTAMLLHRNREEPQGLDRSRLLLPQSRALLPHVSLAQHVTPIHNTKAARPRTLPSPALPRVGHTKLTDKATHAIAHNYQMRQE